MSKNIFSFFIFVIAILTCFISFDLNDVPEELTSIQPAETDLFQTSFDGYSPLMNTCELYIDSDVYECK